MDSLFLRFLCVSRFSYKNQFWTKTINTNPVCILQLWNYILVYIYLIREFDVLYGFMYKVSQKLTIKFNEFIREQIKALTIWQAVK